MPVEQAEAEISPAKEDSAAVATASVPQGPPKRRVLNVRLLVVTFSVLAVAALTLYFVRDYQLRRSADALLTRADQLDESRRWSESLAYLRHYAALRPDDAEIHARIAETYDRAANGRADLTTAIRLYYRAVGVEPNRSELRRRLVELLVQDRQWSVVEEQARRLRKLGGDENERTALRALAIAAVERAGEHDVPALIEARRRLTEAHDAFPDDDRVAFFLAVLLRERGELLGLDAKQAVENADGVMDASVANSDRPDDAHLRRFTYRQRYELDGADEDIEEALRLGLKNVDVLMAAGDHFLSGDPQSTSLARARDCFLRATELAPQLDRAYVGLGRSMHAAGERAEAETTWKRGLRKCASDNISLRNELFQYYLSEQKVAEASRTLEELAKAVEARSTSGTREERSSHWAFLSRLRAQLALVKGDAANALSVLNDTLGKSNGRGGESSGRNALERNLLAQAYRAIQCWDLAAIEFERLAAANPSDFDLQMSAAEAWRRSGQVRPAAVAALRASRCANATADVWSMLAETQLELQRSQTDPASRNWKVFHDAIRKAKRTQPDGWETAALEGEYAVVDGTPDVVRRAVHSLRAAEAAHPKAIDFWSRLPRIYERLEQPSHANRAAAHLRSLDPDAIETTLALVDLLAERQDFDAAATLLDAALRQASDSAASKYRERRLRLTLQFDRIDAARGYLEEMVQSRPRDLRLLRQAADLAASARDWAALARYENLMNDAEGDSGVVWRLYRARRLLTRVAEPSAADLNEAAALISQIESRRTGWFPATTLSAFIAERRGDFDRALELYRDALDQGERAAATYERMAMLLLSENRLAEASALFERIAATGVSSSNIESLSIEAFARRDQLKRAVEIARRAVESFPEDPIRRVWLANVYSLVGDADSAAAEFRTALELGPDDARVWSSLFVFHHRRGDAAKAEQVLQLLSERTSLPAAERAFVAGQAYELMGKTTQAERYLARASELAPDDLAIAMRLAALQVKTDSSAAKATLQRILAANPRLHVARRTLANLLATSDGQQGWAEAERLLAQSGDDAATPVDNERLRAILLLRQPNRDGRQLRSLAEVRAVLEARIQGLPQSDPMDRLILAAICEREGQLSADARHFDAADTYLRPLAEEPRPNEGHLRAYVAYRLRYAVSGAIEKLPDAAKRRTAACGDAEHFLGRLEQLQRDAGRFPAISSLELRIALLHTIGKSGEVTPLIEARGAERMKLLADVGQRSTWMLSVAELYESLGDAPAAERWLQGAHKLDAANFAALADHHARHGRADEAVALCESALATDETSAAAIVLAKVVTAGRPRDAAWDRVEKHFAKAVGQHPDDAALSFAVAVAHAAAGRSEDAIRLFERVVALEPRHVLALNNLATLLTDNEARHDDALKFVERAMQVAGRQPMLLDTQGTIFLRRGDAENAIRVLFEAVQSDGGDARYWLHLAAAHRLAGQLTEARSALARAAREGLQQQILTAGDQQLRRELDNLL